MSPLADTSNKLPRRELLYGAVTLAACSLLTECGYSANSHSESSSGSSPSTPETASGPVLTVTSSAVGAIPASFLGFSYEKLTMNYPYFRTTNGNLIGLFRLLGKGVLRIGGSSVEQIVFTEARQGTHSQVTPTEINALAGFLKQTGWQCIYGLGFATSTPALAAQEAAYVYSALGASLLGIEIGNEPDEYSISGHYFVGDWTLQDFVARWESFRDAILEVAPNAPFTGPATGGGNNIKDWTVPFGQATGSGEISLLTQHYYRGSGQSAQATAAYLVSPDPQLVGDLTLLSAGALALTIPYRLTECNSFYAGGAPGVSNSYASSLWIIDFLFTAATSNAVGVNMHGGSNQPGYTPIADDSGGVIEARPEYYGMLFFSLAGEGTLLETQLSGEGLDATAYAVKTISGGLNLMLVNKNPASGFALTIVTNQSIQTASQQIMTGASLSALSGILIQGAPVSKNGSFAPAPPVTLVPFGKQTTCYLPALSATLISIT